MRILYDYAAFVMQGRGGVSRVLYELFKSVSELGDVEVMLFAGFHKNLYLRDAPQEVKRRIIGWYLPEKVIKQRVFMPINRLLFQIYARCFRPDVCHLTYFDLPRLPENCKVVITIHDMINELYPEMFAVDDPQCTWKKKAVKRADGVVCVSENTLKDLKKFIDLKNTETCVIYHGNSFADVEPISLTLDKPYFLYVGSRFIAYKNFYCVLETLAHKEIGNNVSLVCFGGGDLKFQELKLIEKFGLSERVLQVSGSDELLAAYYKNASALIYPSTYEGFGLPPLEAMGFGCPVVVSSAPPMPEIVENAGLYFNPNSSDELAGCLKSVLSKKIRKRLSDLGVQQSRKFQWNNKADQLTAFYKQLLKN